MLAFKLPIPQGYDLAITLYSLVIAVAASRPTRCGWCRSRRCRTCACWAAD
jgi:NO-binding membrane sensor protein with MHYT domain